MSALPNARNVLQKEATRPVQLRPASFEDYPAVAALNSRYGLRIGDCAEWSNLWLSNPAYKQLGRNWPIGWVLERAGELVGHIGNIPALYTLRGRPLFAALSRGWVVDANSRGYSILLLNMFLNQKTPELFLGGQANAEASKALEAFGASRVPAGQWDRTYFWITNYRALTARWLRRKRVAAPGLIGFPLAAALRLSDAFGTRKLRALNRGIEFQVSDSFDSRFEAFWEGLKQEKSDRLLAVRTREVLEWRFCHAQTSGNLFILSASRNDRLIAYCILLKRENPGYGVRLLIADFQEIGGNSQLIYPMLVWALKECRKEGIERLEVIGGRVGDVDLTGIAPYARPLPAWTFYFKTSRPALEEVLRKSEFWSPSIMDGDGTL